jgi:hypothetical protein
MYFCESLLEGRGSTVKHHTHCQHSP